MHYAVFDRQMHIYRKGICHLKNSYDLKRIKKNLKFKEKAMQKNVDMIRMNNPIHCLLNFMQGKQGLEI